VTAAQPTPARKRGTGPTPKKSKVITKSGLLKRGQRNPLYRPTPAEPTAAVDPTPTAAPIISPPIIPDALLERPAALEVFIEPAPDAPVEALAADETPVAPAKTRRGRPKAAPAVTDATPAAAPSEEASLTTAPSAPVDSTKVPAKKATARAPRVVKPKAKAPKKETAKPAAPRRGRPPSKKTPPPDEEPAS
jgi:sialidase-1